MTDNTDNFQSAVAYIKFSKALLFLLSRVSPVKDISEVEACRLVGRGTKLQNVPPVPFLRPAAIIKPKSSLSVHRRNSETAGAEFERHIIVQLVLAAFVPCARSLPPH